MRWSRPALFSDYLADSTMMHVDIRRDRPFQSEDQYLIWYERYHSRHDDKVRILSSKIVGPESRDRYRQSFIAMFQFCMQYQLVVDLSQYGIPLDVFVRSPRTRKSVLADHPMILWLNENCPNHRRVGPLVGFNDENEMFAFRMRWA